jgi:SNF family Na+-dependent transporter
MCITGSILISSFGSLINRLLPGAFLLWSLILPEIDLQIVIKGVQVGIDKIFKVVSTLKVYCLGLVVSTAVGEYALHIHAEGLF